MQDTCGMQRIIIIIIIEAIFMCLCPYRFFAYFLHFRCRITCTFHVDSCANDPFDL